MKVSESAEQAITNFIEEGRFVCLKLGDDSELFIHKDGEYYRAATEHRFKLESTKNYSDLKSLYETIDVIRGWGIYRHHDYIPMSKCDS